uniref:Uncharacterized protein n=1 Tax=Spermophilus dauricus TaxID=99837 RepID=A0A8C9QE88_SPEDA
PGAQPSPHVLPAGQREGLTNRPAAPTPPTVGSEFVTVPRQPLAPSSEQRKAVPSLGDLSVSPSSEGTPVPLPTGTEVSMEPQLVPDSTEGKTPPEPLREEDEVALATDLEIFLDTLRSMEPPEILRTHRLPRAPRSSYLAMYATLPAIEEDQPGPCVQEPSPQEVPPLEEEEEEEPENPYLSDDEKLQRRQEKVGPSPSGDLPPARPTPVSCSPLEMLKKHVSGARSLHPEPGADMQASGRPTSRLGGSLLFGSLLPATKEASALQPLGKKLSALPPHGAPGLRKVPGQLPLLCGRRPPPEKPACAEPPEGWPSTEDPGQAEHQAWEGDHLLRTWLSGHQQGGL